MGEKKPTYEELEIQVLELQAELNSLKKSAFEHAHVEEALQESEEKHRNLFMSSRDSIMMLEPPSWNFTSANPATVELFEVRDEEEFVSLSPWDLSPEKQPDGRLSSEKAKEMIETAMREGSHFFEWTHKKFNGDAFPATVLLTRMNLRNEPLLQATVRDISKQVQAEKELIKANEQLLQAQKMDALGTLAGGIAHDFNNILATIIGTAEVALKRTTSEDINVRGLNRILECGKRAKDLTMKLLTFARKEKLNIKSVPVDSIVSDVLDMLKSSITNNIRIETRYTEEPLIITADTNQIVHALLNICINACDAMPDGGVLSVTTSEVLLDKTFCKTNTGVVPGKHCVIQISDTGTGIRDEIKDKIFEPFFTTKPSGKGTGLGLSITFGIIKSHGGTIELSSEPGAGTSAKIFLPITEHIKEDTDNNVVDEEKGNEEIILIVDDDRNFVDMLKEVLEMQGYRVIVALSGKEGVEKYKKHHEEIDLVILDMIMLEMNGYAVFHALREVNPDEKIVLCSGYSVDGLVSELLNKGARAFIQKPFDVTQLSLAVSGALHSDN